jgi:putative flippase GtrA
MIYPGRPQDKPNLRFTIYKRFMLRTYRIALSRAQINSSFWHNRLFRFLLVGGINTFFGYSIYALCLFSGLDYSAAYLLALIAGILFSFRSLGIYVFNNPDHRLFGRFLLFWLLLYGLNMIIIPEITNLGPNAYEAGLIMIAPNTIFSYMAQRNFIFSTARSVS